MNKIYLIANWKMQLLDFEAKQLTSDIVNLDPPAGETEKNRKIEIILCPSFVSINSVRQTIQNSNIKLGAQNL